MRENLSILEKELSIVKPGQRFILGIDGLSRSGKTTLVRQLKESLKEKSVSTYVFHLDNFIVERNRRYNTGFEAWSEYYQLQWDIEWLTYNFFSKLRAEKELIVPFYDSEKDQQRFGKITLPKSCYIIIEGVFLQRKEWKHFLDYAVYIDSPREKRYRREHEKTQENLEKFENRYWKAEGYYLEVESPKTQANLVLQN